MNYNCRSGKANAMGRCCAGSGDYRPCRADAGTVKPGNLFNHTIGEDFHTVFAGLYGQLQEKGVTLQVLRGKALIYIYRKPCWASTPSCFRM